MIKSVLYLFLILFFKFSFGQQNLVFNGSFEIISNCPIGADIYNAQGWFSPNNTTPDLFNSCADISTNLSVPTNAFGYQNAFEGNGYAGIVTYSFNFSSIIYREYLETRLINNLENQKIYEVSFYMNLSNNSPVGNNNLTFGFCNDTSSQSLMTVINPDFSKENTSINIDTTSWIKFSSYYIAHGWEKYLIIGNFEDDTNTDTIQLNQNNSDVYYYIDNVSVTEHNFGVENIFTPNNDNLNDLIFQFTDDLSEIRIEIFNRWGNLVKKVNTSIGWDGKDENGLELLDGVYFYKVLINDKYIKTGFVQLTR